MELRKLQYFMTVCDHMNMTKAAEILHIAQPSISIAIKSLEEEIGFELFDRTKRQLKLTDKGQLFKSRAKDLLGHAQNMTREMQDLGKSDMGFIKLGIPPMIGTLLFPKILIDYKAKNPYINLQITEDGSLETKRKIMEGELDLGIIILSDKEEVLESTDILKTEIVACMNKSHPLGRHSRLTPERIQKEKLIMLKEGFYHREVLLDYFKRSHIRPEIAVSTNQLKTLESLVIQGVGISFLFKELVMENSQMIYRPMDESMPIRIGLAWRRDRYLTKASKTLIEFLNTN
ncbi:LysR family transcriptional regulator [Fusibacter sp. JL216-2]|uniref:LysR family transcriptional regulator n=1 Tax=Fusibacter sp. JL216-2 TaxID=3071453 RepID=UPI003D33B4AF